MRKLRAMKVRQLGFTLVELLVVIAVIGVLASVVLVAINPIEQINRAKDAGAKSALRQVVDANQRYVTVNGGQFPNGGVAGTGSPNQGQKPLIDAGELKSQVDQVIMYSDGTYYQVNAYMYSKASILAAQAGLSQNPVMTYLAPGTTTCLNNTQVILYYYSGWGDGKFRWYC